MHRRPLAHAMVPVTRARVRAHLLKRDKPVPVQQRDVVVDIRRRVPAQQVIMKRAELARRVMMPDIVEIGLRKRNMDHAGDQKPDRKPGKAMLPTRSRDPHASPLDPVRRVVTPSHARGVGVSNPLCDPPPAWSRNRPSGRRSNGFRRSVESRDRTWRGEAATTTSPNTARRVAASPDHGREAVVRTGHRSNHLGREPDHRPRVGARQGAGSTRAVT